jgi:CheY-like chemotaxis protein
MKTNHDYTVLLVEDDANDVLLIQRAFRMVNTDSPIHSVRDGDAAIDYLSNSGEYADQDEYVLPQLILLDLKLPRRSGVEVLQWIRQQPVIKRIPVIILTSSKESIDVNLSYDLGISSYLVKPVSFDRLSEMVATVESYWLRINEYPTLASTN